MNQNVQPDLLSSLEREVSYIDQQSAGKSLRIKIPKNHVWRCRMLPVEQGESKLPWGRYVFHWINNRPYMCPKTPAEFGGIGDDAACPLCDTAEALNRDRDRQVSRIGYRAMGVPQWLVYALVLSKDNGDREVAVREPELWNPWEFWLTKGSMSDIATIYKQYRRRTHRPEDGPDYSFMDLLDGTTLSVKCRNKGLLFTPERPGPIVDRDRYDEVSSLIWSKIKFPDNVPPSDRELTLLARKLEELAADPRLADDFRGRDDRGRGDYDENDERDGRRSSGRYHDDDRGDRSRDDDRDFRGDERADDRSRRDYDREPDRDERAGRRSGGDRHDDDHDLGPARQPAPPPSPRAPAPPARSSAAPTAPPASRPAPPAASRVSPPSRVAAPPSKPASRLPAPPARPGVSSVSEEEDNAPDERRDPAPPVDPEPSDLPPNVDAEGAATEQPEAPKASPPPPPRSLSERLRNGISAASKR